MPVTLTIPSGFRSGSSIIVPEGQSVEIGRTSPPDNAFRDDQFMSRLHMRVSCNETECVVLDLSSSNGTYVNGIRIREALVKDGDHVRAGETYFVVAVTPFLRPSPDPLADIPSEAERIDRDEKSLRDELLSTRLK